eukprot:g29878.t1
MPAGETAEATERFRDRRPTKSVPGSGVDLYSNWLVKLGLKHIGLLFGNCLDLLVIDWPAKLELASIRLTVTQTFKNQHDGML